MEVKRIKGKLFENFRKYKYSILVVLFGLLLMSFPGKTTRKVESVPISNLKTDEQQLEERLSELLSQVSGAGKVEVVLTASAGEEVIYQTNNDSSTGDANTHEKSNTVTITDAQRNQTGLIRQVNPERYLGAIILCQGADDPGICLAIVDAVSKVTGLGSNKISVLKMK